MLNSGRPGRDSVRAVTGISPRSGRAGKRRDAQRVPDRYVSRVVADRDVREFAGLPEPWRVYAVS